jgi:ubiquitin-like modifier-activating enzyme 5
MAIVAGLLVQTALKFLLHFGSVGSYVGYNALSDHFPSVILQPSADCRNELCRTRQQQFKAFLAAKAAAPAAPAAAASSSSSSSAPPPAENPFGFVIVEESHEEEETAPVDSWDTRMEFPLVDLGTKAEDASPEALSELALLRDSFLQLQAKK